MDNTENRRKWQAFLQPLRISHSPVKSLSNIKLKTRVPGAQCLSQTFADKLLENTNKPITIKGHSEDVQKAQKISQQQQDDYSSTVLKTRKERSSEFTAVESSSVPAEKETISEVRSSKPARKNSIYSLIEETWKENQWKDVKSIDTNHTHVPGQINVEFFDNSKENPIAISDDDSTEEVEIVSLASRKRKQRNDSETDVLGTKQVPDDLPSTSSAHGKDEEHSNKILADTFSRKAKKIKGEEVDLDTSPSTPSMSLTLKNESKTDNATVLTDETAFQLSDNDVIKFAGETLPYDMKEESCNKSLKNQSLKEELVTESQIPVSKQPSGDFSSQSTEDKTIQLGSMKIRTEPIFQNVIERSLDMFSKEPSHTHTAELSFQELANLTREYSIERSRTKNEYSPSKKDDIDKPCSQWKMDMFVRYFDFEKCVQNLELEKYRDFSKDSDLNDMVADFKRRVKIASSTLVEHRTDRGDTNTWGKKTEEKQEIYDISKEEVEEGLSFASLCRTEMGTRLILNEILFPLCSILDFTVEIERNVDCVYLPNCRFDYRIYDSDGEIVGAVEAKRGGSIRPDSVVQAVLELCILQAERLSKLQNVPKRLEFPLFNILTDGMRFVFIILKGDKLYFEQSFNKIRVREMTSWTEVCHLYGSLLQLMRMRTEEEWVSSAWKLEL